MTGESSPRRRPRNQRRRERARATPGPGINFDLMDRCAMLRIEGRSWAEIARATGVGYSTLMEWRLLPDWEQSRLRVLSAIPESVLFLARRVFQKRLLSDLAQKRPETATAEMVLEWEWRARARGDEDGRGSTIISGGVTIYKAAGQGGQILLPMHDQGEKSRPPGEVLGAASAAPGAQPAPAATPAPKGKKGRRVAVVPDGEGAA